MGCMEVILNNKFYSLSNEKQEKIINAALLIFSKYDYKKASTDAIAKEAEISKSLLFHYFENKKGLYLFLYNYGIEFITKNMTKELNLTETDFFNLMINSQEIKCNMMKKHPFLFNFLIKAYYEDAPEVTEGINSQNKIITDNNIELVLSRIDKSKFKDSVDINLLIKILIWCGDGFMKEKQLEKTFDIDQINKEFQAILYMLKKNFYKEEYL